MNVRRLTLKREVLRELSSSDLAAVAGAAPPDVTELTEVAQTMYSCLHYISCAFLHTCYARTIPCAIGTVQVTG